MKFQNFVVVFFLCIGFSKINAQNFALGKVSIAELEEKVHPIDSSAPAAILFTKGLVKINNMGYTERITQTRIKIYKKEGYHWSNMQFTFPSGKLSAISITDVYTYNLVDGKIVKSKLKSESEFLDKITKDFWAKKFAFPDVKEGSILEFQVKIIGGSLNIPDWDFQKSIPVNFSEFRTIIPDVFSFKKNMKGFFIPKSNSQVANTYGYMAMESIYSLQNVPAMQEEDFVNNMNNYRASISHELESISIPGQLFKTFSSSWPSVARTIYEFEDFGPELRKTGYFEDNLKLLLADKIKPEDKISTIFNYVKSNIKWNQHLGYGCENGVKKAYKEKSGNCADINLMLTSMLRYAGLDANPVLISTRSNGISFFPSTSGFNYVIAGVETPQGMILLDATDDYATINVLPVRDLNWFGRSVRKDGASKLVELMPKKSSADIVALSFEISESGKIEGKARRQYSDYHALNFREKIAKDNEETYIEKFENENNKIELSDYKRVNEKEFSLPISESFSFAGSDLVEIIGGKIYLNPMLFFLSEKNPFKQEKREYPVDFGFPSSQRYNIDIKLPDNFTVENLPKPIAVVMQDNLGVFKFDIALSENRIQLSIIHQINEAIVPIGKYDMLKEYYKTMIAKETEKIVLKRI
ncbi:DUF3857 domain-containing protein [Flavobacterium sp. LHD-80]|uniref:DUF3857 domain-containing protein n=1 Tax=Flavobacterium sp. LHD-80 TaxID=3071411 RepID=UPI0027DFA6AB|nr:transglutaminase domain-containing protein [Flavobacterium sp. LHD-80]MDQ6471537.1 DUF3857 domain-containing protein [Flavobacterium sp. LHD-80]